MARALAVIAVKKAGENVGHPGKRWRLGKPIACCRRAEADGARCGRREGQEIGGCVVMAQIGPVHSRAESKRPVTWVFP